MPLRLIDVRTRRFANPAQLWEQENALEDGKSIRYGILSHRWLADTDEVKFGDLGQPEKAERKAGFFKIVETCRLAEQDGLQYVWLDTCCIDKSSSAELQESINSMYHWYQESAVCYVYLKDTDLGSTPGSYDAVMEDEWFSRGWTLQELIAPDQVKFFDKRWTYLGSKHDLRQHIHERTGISLDLLDSRAQPEDFSVAERMSWAANRKTTVVEDRAYSLFGLFGVALPMLYGERGNAFLRLQEEILRTTDDHSIFAWKGVNDHSGLLATSPEFFATCGSVKKLEGIKSRKGHSAYRLTNRGVEITLNLTPWALDTYLARLHCKDMSAEDSGANDVERMTGIFLQRMNQKDDLYQRVELEGTDLMGDVGPPRNWEGLKWINTSREVPIYVHQPRPAQLRTLTTRGILGYQVPDEVLKQDNNGQPLFSFRGPHFCWDESKRLVTIPNGKQFVGWIATLDIARQRKKISAIKFCFDFDFNPVVFVATAKAVGIQEKPSNKHGKYIESGVSIEEEIFGTENLLHYSPHDESCLSHFSERDGKIIASESAPRSGLWALKADRHDGLDVFLSNSRGELVTNVRLLKKTTQLRELVWEFQIEKIPPHTEPLMEKLKVKKKKSKLAVIDQNLEACP